jgi:hypothetical protein
MKMRWLALSLIATTILFSGCGRKIRTATDVTPGHPDTQEALDWRYGANDLKIQTTVLFKQLMDRWYAKTHYNNDNGKPRIIITNVDNQTDTYIPTTMMRDVIEGMAIDDGRFSVVVGNVDDDKELNERLERIQKDPIYNNDSRIKGNNAKAPQFLCKIRLTKAVTYQKRYDIEDYRMTVTLYNIETQEAVDSAWDVLRKKVKL